VTRLTSTGVEDSHLADIARDRSSAHYYGSGIAIYPTPVPGKPGSKRGVVIYDTLTHEEVKVSDGTNEVLRTVCELP
jgi:hypothetical protein